jgi:hypothetical protein
MTTAIAVMVVYTEGIEATVAPLMVACVKDMEVCLYSTLIKQ